MTDTFRILINVLQDLLYIAVFIGAAVLVYFTLQQPRLKGWLTEAGPLVRIVVFIALTELIVIPFNSIISNLFTLPRDLVNLGRLSNLSGDFVVTLAQCCLGVLMLASLGVGAWLLAQRYRADK